MMNDETGQFEQRLSRRPLRQIPAGWRTEILTAAREASALCPASPVAHHGWLTTFNRQLATIFWPHPKAWAGLAVVWGLILAMNVSLREPSPRLAEISAPPSPEMMVELRKQQLLLAELIGPREPCDAERSRNVAPRPRGVRAELVAV
jgi:hypothetical protein